MICRWPGPYAHASVREACTDCIQTRHVLDGRPAEARPEGNHRHLPVRQLRETLWTPVEITDARTLAAEVLAMDDEAFRVAFKKSPVK